VETGGQVTGIIESRFSQIYNLYNKLPPNIVIGIDPPSKHILQMNGLDPQFIAQRKIEIQSYLNQLVARRSVRRHPVFRQFARLGDLNRVMDDDFMDPASKLSRENSMSDSQNEEKVLYTSCPVCRMNLDGLSSEYQEAHVNSCLYATGSPLKDYIPFGVTCPYPQCGTQYEARYLFSHILRDHEKIQIPYECPICTFVGEPTKKGNLLKHLQEVHPYFTIPDNKITTNGQNQLYIDNPHDDYLGQVVLKNDTEECIICLCEFEKGQITVRLPCLCYFHRNCIENWFSTLRRRECPLHRKD